MKLSALAYSSIDQFAHITLQCTPISVTAPHEFIMDSNWLDRFAYIKKGSVTFHMQNGELRGGARDMIYIPGNIQYHSFWPEDSEFVLLNLQMRDAEGQPILFEDKPCVLFHDTHGVYDGLLAELSRMDQAKEAFGWLDRLSISFKLLYEIARDTNRKELDEQSRRIKPALTFLEDNYNNDFSVEDLAKMCSLSVASFRRLFVSCIGTSPLEYRNRLRIQKATELLKFGRYTVGETAEMVGIPDIKYFGKLFKRYTGFSPSVLKKNHL